MHIIKRAFTLLTVFSLAGASLLTGQESSKTVAIFLANRADDSLNDQMPVFEDMITGQLTGHGFEILSREIVIDAVGDLLQVPVENAQDALLGDQTSALRLSQNLGADYLLFASFMGLDTETRSVNAYGVSYQNEIHTLRASYRILDGNTGASIAAGNVTPTRTIQQSAHSQTSAPGLIRELLDKASREIAANLRQQEAQGRIRTVQTEDAQVEFTVSVSLNDVNFPEVVINDDGQPEITPNSTNVQATAVSVELDGFTIGTTGSGDEPTALRASPGLHRIRLSRPDLVPFERMINIHEGMDLNIAMQLNEEGRRRWMENTLMLNDLRRAAVLSDAQAEALRGMAQMLRQSGYKVDIKVDTDEGLTIEQNQNLMKQN